MDKKIITGIIVVIIVITLFDNQSFEITRSQKIHAMKKHLLELNISR